MIESAALAASGSVPSSLKHEPPSSSTCLRLGGFITSRNHFRGLDVPREGLSFIGNITLIMS